MIGAVSPKVGLGMQFRSSRIQSPTSAVQDFWPSRLGQLQPSALPAFYTLRNSPDSAPRGAEKGVNLTLREDICTPGDTSKMILSSTKPSSPVNSDFT